jgi:T-complex protein 1 subunit delta
MSAAVGSSGMGVPRQQRAFKTQDKPDEVRRSNMNAAKAVSDAIRTSLGPKGMDKMVSSTDEERASS